MSSAVEEDVVHADPYFSRIGTEFELFRRADPVIWNADGKSAIDDDQCHAFASDGFLNAGSLFTAQEAASLLSAAEEMADRADKSRADVITEPASQSVRSLFRVHHTSETFRAVAKDPRLVEVARRVLGSDVYVHQSRINFKPAFDGKEFFWHSDFETWHVEDGMPRMRALSVSISLTGNNEFNGPLIVVPGSHLTFVRCVGATPENNFTKSLKKQEVGVPSREALQQLVAAGGMLAPKGEPGSALFFDCNLMHGSAGNLSPFARTNLFIVYNSIENRLVAPFGGTEPRPEFLADRDFVPIDSL